MGLDASDVDEGALGGAELEEASVQGGGEGGRGGGKGGNGLWEVAGVEVPSDNGAGRRGGGLAGSLGAGGTLDETVEDGTGARRHVTVERP